MTQHHGSKNIHWHAAFYEAIQLELDDYKGVFEFKPEFQLTAEPLRIDTLIIKKIRNVSIGKNFAQIFRSDNVLEYKSPDDYLSVKDFYKAYSYACLYTAVTPNADISDITLTFVETRYPKELIRHLREVRHYSITEPWPGIHRVVGDILPIQILESRKLSTLDNIWLRGLNPGLDRKSTSIILEKSGEKEKGAPIRAYLEVFLRANSITHEEVYKMARGYPTMEEVLTNIGLTQKWTEQGLQQGLKQGLNQGLKQGLDQGLKQGQLETARKMKARGDSIKSILEVLPISSEEIENLQP
ncbi:hypothetical protein FACS189450_12910 [Spirochaetia bacterium]|nr:hypothetical protein FACS189450_12910 [Spirochaetia bacterium]